MNRECFSEYLFPDLIGEVVESGINLSEIQKVFKGKITAFLVYMDEGGSQILPKNQKKKEYKEWSMTPSVPKPLTLEEYYKACRDGAPPETMYWASYMTKKSEVSEVDLNSNRPM